MSLPPIIQGSTYIPQNVQRTDKISSLGRVFDIFINYLRNTAFSIKQFLEMNYVFIILKHWMRI
jgi:hypothetical protein